MRIDFVFDTVCPWCYVGKHRFLRALAARPETRVDVRWRPFLLNPDIPLEGIPRDTYLERKFGGPSRIQRIHGAVTAAGKAEGIQFDFERMTRTPNTLHSHRLIRFAALTGAEPAVVEAIFAAYFCQGLDIGRIDVLTDIAGQCGLPADKVAAYLESDADLSTIMNDNARAHRLGVNGVPCLILDGQYAMAGAQEPDILLRLIDIARETAPEPVLS